MHANLRTLLLAAFSALASCLPAAAQTAGRPGDFDYYTLVLSWSPTYCADQGAGRREPQCAPERRYAFVMHGLWPQYARGFPQDCRTVFNPRVPQTVIDGMLDIMPSPGLVIHQYRKHGVCSGLEPKPFFDQARKIYQTVKIPQRFQSPNQAVTTSPAEIAREFVAANPGMTPQMIGVDCARGRLKEVRICFSREGQLKTCGRNEEQGRLCRTNSIVLPPVRSGGPAPAAKSGPLPGPVVPPPAPAGERKI
jgi:ribonuclease T2